MKKPTKEELTAAIHRHVEKSAETVSKIPHHLRTIVSKFELKEN